MRARSVRRLLALALVMVLVAGCDWLQFGGDQTHSNVGIDSQITPENARQLHRTWQVLLPDHSDGQPLYATGVSTPSGKRNLLVLIGHRGALYAFDAGTGQLVWEVPPPNPNACFTVQTGQVSCFMYASPAIDTDTQRVYNYVPYTGQLHQYALGTGQEITGGGWPETVTLKPNIEKASSNLTIAKFGGTKYLYVTTSSFGEDLGDYQGHITTINLANGSQRVFNGLCSNQAVHFVAAPGSPDCPEVGGGIWARSGVIPDVDTGKVYATTGNATFDPANHDWGDTVIALNPDGTGNANGDPIDSWTPSNYAELQAGDMDLGSAEPTLLPPVPGSKVAHLGLQGGKQGLLYFLNLDNLSGQGGPGHVGGEVVWSPARVPQGGQVLGQPVVWTDPQGRVWVLITTHFDLSYKNGTGGVSGSLVLTDAFGDPYLSPQWVIHGAGDLESQEIGPVTKGGVMFSVVDNAIVAVNALNGQALWLAPLPGKNHFETPLATANAVYVADESGHLTAFSL